MVCITIARIGKRVQIPCGTAAVKVWESALVTVIISWEDASSITPKPEDLPVSYSRTWMHGSHTANGFLTGMMDFGKKVWPLLPYPFAWIGFFCLEVAELEEVIHKEIGRAHV